MRGKAMHGKSGASLVMFLFVFAMLLTPSGAVATPCPNGSGFLTHYVNPVGPEGTFCVEPIELAGLATCGTAPCYRFAYGITSLAGESLSAVNLTIPAAAKFCTISILSPTERSVKIREYEPSTGFSLADTNTDLVTWDALKLDPSNKTNIDVYLTQTGAGPQVMELKTGTGTQYVDLEGPICCSETQIEVSTCWNVPGEECDSSQPATSFTVEYDSCTGKPISTLGDLADFELVKSWLCRGFTEDSYDAKTCVEIKKLGPRSGAVLYADDATYYGFGNRIYRGPIIPVSSPTQSTCTASGAPYPQVVNYDNLVKVTFDECGNATSVVDPATGQDFQPWESLWIGWSLDLNGKRPEFFSRVVAGPANGALIYANPRCIYIGGYPKCY